MDPIGNRLMALALSSREQQRKNCARTALWSLRFFFLLSLFSLDGGMTTDIFLWTRKMPYQVIPFLSSLLVYLTNNNERPSLALSPHFGAICLFMFFYEGASCKSNLGVPWTMQIITQRKKEGVC